MPSSPKDSTSHEPQVNLRAIAERCGLGVMTVSRALRGEKFVAPATRERVLAVAAELGYDPSRNQMARQMVLRRHGIAPLNHTFGLYFPPLFTRDSLALYYGPIFDGIMTVAVLERYSVHTNYISYPQSEAEPFPYDMITQLPRAFCHGDVDGVLLIAKPHEQQHVVAMLRQEPNFSNRPIVTMIEPTEGCAAVLTDDATSAYAAVMHLYDLGHRRFLYFSEPHEYFCREQRLVGYRRALQARGLDPDTALVCSAWDWDDVDNSLAMFMQALDSYPDTTAIFAHHDPMACMLYQVLRTKGFDVPTDISLLGHDDTIPLLDPVSNLTLTSTHLPLDAVGREATRLLLRLIAEPSSSTEPIILHTTFIPRGSIGPAKCT
jgi:LacI family transcriptional regulator